MLRRVFATALGSVEIRFTEAGDGDFAVALPTAVLATRRARVHPGPWSWLRQVHGADVHRVEGASGNGAGGGAGADAVEGAEGDALLCNLDDTPIAVHTADCGPLALVGENGPFAVVHAGWRGTEVGVIAAAVAGLSSMNAGPLSAVLGPTIGPECYEFGESDLDRLTANLGHQVRSVTSDNRPALDMAAAVVSRLRGAGVAEARIEVVDRCTGCDPGFFSHRARTDRGRQALVAWREGHRSPRESADGATRRVGQETWRQT